MPKFRYTAKSRPDTVVKADIEAASEQEAVRMLTEQGIFPLTLLPSENSLSAQAKRRPKSFPLKAVASMTRELSTLVSARVDIISALSITSKQLRDKRFADVLSSVSARIKDGAQLSDSLAQYPSVFSPLYCSMIKTAEVSGTLGPALERLAVFLEDQVDFRESLKSGLTYPLFIMVVGTGTVIFLLSYVIPKFAAMFEDMGQALPLPTMLLMKFSSLVQSYWWVAALCLPVACVIFVKYLKTSAGKRTIDSLKLKLPVFGQLVLKTETGRLTRTLSLMVSSGIPITQALSIGTTVSDNEIVRAKIQTCREQVSTGMSLSLCLRSLKFFPEFVENIVRTGEETGSLDKSLLRIAQSYEREVSMSVKALTRLLEPVMIMVMGVIVGFIVMAMLLPIFELNLAVR